MGTYADASLSTGTVLGAVCLVAAVEPIPGGFHGPHFEGVRYYRLAFYPRGAGELEAFQRVHAPDRGLDELISAALNDVSKGSAPTEAEAVERRTVRGIVERAG